MAFLRLCVQKHSFRVIQGPTHLGTKDFHPPIKCKYMLMLINFAWMSYIFLFTWILYHCTYCTWSHELREIQYVSQRLKTRAVGSWQAEVKPGLCKTSSPRGNKAPASQHKGLSTLRDGLSRSSTSVNCTANVCASIEFIQQDYSASSCQQSSWKSDSDGKKPTRYGYIIPLWMHQVDPNLSETGCFFFSFPWRLTSSTSRTMTQSTLHRHTISMM